MKRGIEDRLDALAVIAAAVGVATDPVTRSARRFALLDVSAHRSRECMAEVGGRRGQSRYLDGDTMATWEDVRRLALALPQASERVMHGKLMAWEVGGKLFAWERPLRKSDLLALGADAPDGPILGARVADLDTKDALLADDPAVFFTTPHFDGYAAVLVRLGEITVGELRELIADAWLARAPKRIAAEYRRPARRLAGEDRDA